MSGRFDYFIVLAEMRTGSNFLEANLNAIDGVTCYGEAFNPHFIGYPNVTEILGVTQDAREADPAHLIATMRDRTEGIGGFRFFHDHDPRALDMCLDDPRCAKIILTRNPLDSYVSWKIAQATDQWKLTNVKRRKDGVATFDAGEFETHLAALQGFQVMLLNRLQKSGQTAFYVAYEDLQDLDVMNGLARFLGCEGCLEALDDKLKRQNPAPLESKVANYGEMRDALARIDRFDLTRTPNFEPRRGPVVPGYVAAPQSPLLYMPIRSGPEAEVCQWLAALDGAGPEALLRDFTQKSLRQWKRRHGTHRSFTVLRHPAARAHAAFCTKILSTGEGSFSKIRQTLKRVYKLPIPRDGPGANYTAADHRTAFLEFLDFVQKNLAGQTSLRVDAHWCSQAQALQGMADFAQPDMVLREDEMPTWLPALASGLGIAAAPALPASAPDAPFALDDVYDDEVEDRVRNVYQRDYVMFGFGPWRG